MSRYFQTKHYSLSTKVILLFLISMLFLSALKFLLFQPFFEQKEYEYKINETTQILNANKEQIELSITASRNQAKLEVALSKKSITLQLYDLIKDKKTFTTHHELLRYLNNSKIGALCQYKLSNTPTLNDSFFEFNDLSILNKWYRYEKNSITYDDAIFFYNKKISPLNTIFSLACDKQAFQRRAYAFEQQIHDHIHKTMSPLLESYDVKTSLLWLDNPELKTSQSLKDLTFQYNKRGYKLKQLLNINDFQLGNATLKQILEVKNSGPISHKIDDKEVLTWVINLEVSKKQNAYLLLFSIDKKNFIANVKSEQMTLLPEFIISVVLTCLLVFLLLKKSFNKINKLTKTATKIKKGQKKIRSQVKGDDDIGVLGESFDSMIDFFENSIETLDETVKQKTQEISRSLEEKEVLLKEVHHRVKNNLSLTIGMIELQEKDIKDQETQKALNDIKDRIYTMELLHRKLYESSSLNEIEMNEYMSDLIEVISQSYDKENLVNVFLDIDPITLNLQDAMPYGLILNELASNAYKHAFKASNDAKLYISFTQKGEYINLRVKDSGQGLQKAFDDSKYESLGLKLIYTIVKLQLFGEITQSNDDGCEFLIRVKTA